MLEKTMRKSLDINKFTDAVNAIDWAKYKLPDYMPQSHVSHIPQALIALATVEKEDKQPEIVEIDGRKSLAGIGSRSYVIGAIGNDHSGTYYAVAKDAVGFILEVALHGGNEFARRYALEVLYDLFCFNSEDEDLALELFVHDTIRRKKIDFVELEKTDTYNQERIIWILECIAYHEIKTSTIEQLENSVWDEPPPGNGSLMDCYKLRKIPICDLSAWDLVRLVNGQVGLKYILPAAFKLIEENPMCGVGGGFSSGLTLLGALAGIDKEFWSKNPMLAEDMNLAIRSVDYDFENYHKHIKAVWEKKIGEMPKKER